MEAIGAIASIAQVAQLGTQLSLSLYNLAQTVGSANKDVQYVAKDISLFSAVLKDLGRAFERGKHVKLYRADVYDTSLLIVKECKGVFSEIEEVLKKSSKDGWTIDKGISLDRVGKFMWLFRKSRVQLLRGNLESLKSTILVELAVLNYAEKVSSSAESGGGDVNDLLALKSLVLANEAATQEFRELINSTEDDLSSGSPAFGPMATYGIGNLVHGRLLTSNGVMPPVTTQLAKAQVQPSTMEPGLQMAPPIQHNRGASKGTSVGITSTTIPTSPRSLGHAKAWGVQDRIEHALRRVELAIWEQERIEENLLTHQSGRGNDQSQVTSIYLQRLVSRLTLLGLSPITARNVASLFHECNSQLGVRTLTDQTLAPSAELYGILRQLNVTWTHPEGETGTIRLKRWMPDLLEDILWEHTRRSIRAPSGMNVKAPQYPVWTDTFHHYAPSRPIHDQPVGRPSPPSEQQSSAQVGLPVSSFSSGETSRSGNSTTPSQVICPLKRAQTPEVQLPPPVLQQQQARQEVPQLPSLPQSQYITQQSQSYQQGTRRHETGASARFRSQRTSHKRRINRREVTYEGPQLVDLEDAQRQKPWDPASQSDRIGNHSLIDYQNQLMLGEQQNKKRLMMAQQEHGNETILPQVGYTFQRFGAERAQTGPDMPNRADASRPSLSQTQMYPSVGHRESDGGATLQPSEMKGASMNEVGIQQNIPTSEVSVPTWHGEDEEPLQSAINDSTVTQGIKENGEDWKGQQAQLGLRPEQHFEVPNPPQISYRRAKSTKRTRLHHSPLQHNEPQQQSPMDYELASGPEHSSQHPKLYQPSPVFREFTYVSVYPFTEEEGQEPLPLIQDEPPRRKRRPPRTEEHNRHKTRAQRLRPCEGCRTRKIICDSMTTNLWPCAACVRLKLHCVPPTVNYNRVQGAESNAPALERILDFDNSIGGNGDEDDPALRHLRQSLQQRSSISFPLSDGVKTLSASEHLERPATQTNLSSNTQPPGQIPVESFQYQHTLPPASNRAPYSVSSRDSGHQVHGSIKAQGYPPIVGMSDYPVPHRHFSDEAIRSPYPASTNNFVPQYPYIPWSRNNMSTTPTQTQDQPAAGTSPSHISASNIYQYPSTLSKVPEQAIRSPHTASTNNVVPQDSNVPPKRNNTSTIPTQTQDQPAAGIPLSSIFTSNKYHDLSLKCKNDCTEDVNLVHWDAEGPEHTLAGGASSVRVPALTEQEEGILGEKVIEGDRDDASKAVERLLELWTFVDTSARSKSNEALGGTQQPV